MLSNNTIMESNTEMINAIDMEIKKQENNGGVVELSYSFMDKNWLEGLKKIVGEIKKCDNCDNPAVEKDEDSTCYECDGSCGSCKNPYYWNLCEDCFKEECGDEEQELFKKCINLKIDLIIKGIEKIDENSIGGQEKLKLITQQLAELNGIIENTCDCGENKEDDGRCFDCEIRPYLCKERYCGIETNEYLREHQEGYCEYHYGNKYGMCKDVCGRKKYGKYCMEINIMEDSGTEYCRECMENELGMDS